MSVGIYPWPAQILYDSKNSKIVNLFEEFCINKCEYFFNTFPHFFEDHDLKDKSLIISENYIKNDVHFNVLGNKKIYENFILNFKN